MMSFPLTSSMLYWTMVLSLWRYPFSSHSCDYYYCFFFDVHTIILNFSYCGCRINGLDYVASMSWAERPLKNVGLRACYVYSHSLLMLLYVGHETKRLPLGEDIHIKQAWECSRRVILLLLIRYQCNPLTKATTIGFLFHITRSSASVSTPLSYILKRPAPYATLSTIHLMLEFEADNILFKMLCEQPSLFNTS